MRNCCPLNRFFPHRNTQPVKEPRKVIAWDLDETLFFAQNKGSTLKELIDERELAPGIINHLADTTSQIKPYSDQISMYFLHPKKLTALFKVFEAKKIIIVFITSGAWSAKQTIRLINYALDLTLPLNTHFINKEAEKAKKLTQAYPGDDICLVENDIYHIEQAALYDNVTTIRAKHNNDTRLNTEHHLNEINRWIGCTANQSPQPSRVRTYSFETSYQSMSPVL
jgi:hypothetical protein